MILTLGTWELFNFLVPNVKELEVAKELFEKNENLRLPVDINELLFFSFD